MLSLVGGCVVYSVVLSEVGDCVVVVSSIGVVYVSFVLSVVDGRVVVVYCLVLSDVGSCVVVLYSVVLTAVGSCVVVVALTGVVEDSVVFSVVVFVVYCVVGFMYCVVL